MSSARSQFRHLSAQVTQAQSSTYVRVFARMKSRTINMHRPNISLRIIHRIDVFYSYYIHYILREEAINIHTCDV